MTGGASGLGRARCEQLAADGTFAVVADLNIGKAEEVAAAIRQRGGCAKAASLDVSREAEVQHLASNVVAAHGRLDYMFSSAAVAMVGEFRDGNAADLRRVVDVNLFGVVHCTMAAEGVFHYLCLREHQEELLDASLQNQARPLRHGADDVHKVDRGGERRRAGVRRE